MGKKNIKSFFPYFVIFGACVFFVFVSVTFLLIRRDVKKICESETRRYSKSCVRSLTIALDDETRDFKERNSAVWALGQLADKNALPVLRKHYTGNIPKRESLSNAISQYELKKAIKWCEKGNMTSWMYKGF